jgi:SAM-dependent methyltransferase
MNSGSGVVTKVEIEVGVSSRRLLVFRGSCYVCGMRGRARTVYVERGSWARDHLQCFRCKAIPRERCLAYMLDQLRPTWRDLDIHESSPSPRGLSAVLSEFAPGYSSSQFMDGVESGSLVDGVEVQDLANLSFDDARLDVLITQDVLEHVMHPEEVLAEVRRVLKPGGIHLATFPWNPQMRSTRRRARLDDAGRVVHELEAQYHGSPVGDGRSLVTVDWGADVFSIANEAGFDLEVIRLEHNRRLGIDGEFREVFAFTPH